MFRRSIIILIRTRFTCFRVAAITAACAASVIIETQTDFEVLVWSDIVRDSMSSTIPATYWQLAKTAWLYISSGTLRRLAWLA